MSFADFLFWVVALLTGLSAVMVVVTQNIVRAALWLLFTLAGTAGLFFLLGADFVGAVQLLVYVGGILILLVFGVMLTAQGPFVNLRAGAGEWAVAIVVGLLLLGLLGSAFLMTDWRFLPTQPPDPATSRYTNDLGLALLGSRDATPPGTLPVHPGDQPVERSRVAYLLPFEIVSVHLLVVLIGAAYLARARRRRGART
ncbi:MAG: NADH-quinone oxidoreductase subunit J [Gemmatales bacterium]|nr:NADH-quinone oxidoreductase subunit J [Gemmatales bacterium]MDW8385533.1 NADH-quinone oxidoreductase subunit J [Gemmatales bacterium]